MNRLIRAVAEKCLNGGLPLLLMGILWLGLWLFAWYSAYLQDPHWGHNYAESTAFLAVGLAYFNRRFLSDVLAFLVAIMIIPTSLELLPVTVTAITSAVLTALIIADIIVELKPADDLFRPREAKRADCLKKYLPCLSYIMLASLALIYFLIRVPAGTYETDIETVAFDALLVPYVVLLIIEKLTGERRTWPKLLAFFFGMLIMIMLLILMADEPATRPVLAFVSIVTALGVIDLVLVDYYRKSHAI
jgi:hypothetical protein